MIRLKIKRASEVDIKAVARVYVDGWRTTYHGLVPDDYLDRLSYEEAEQKWLNFLIHENEPFIYIAMNDAGKIIGFAAGKSIDDENFNGELYSLYLLQECRGFDTRKTIGFSYCQAFYLVSGRLLISNKIIIV